MADDLKLLTKEDLFPRYGNRFLYNLALVMALVPATLVFAVVPFGNTEVVGVILFSKYFLAFELVSLVLLIGMIGAVLIGRKESQVYEDDTP